MGDLAWYIPVLIFCARIADVSIGTIRMIFVIAGWRYRAAALGFVEVLIWALAIGGLIQYITHPVALLSYCGGFAAGNLVGMMIEQKLALGIRVVQVINRDLAANLPDLLREHGYRVTRVPGEGKDGPVEIAFAVVRRRALPQIMALIERHAPDAIVTVERAEHASEGAFGSTYTKRRLMLSGVGGLRK
ncbi:MAG: DUF2179 domain-containing protein [Phycisphaeraceae bacterium]